MRVGINENDDNLLIDINGQNNLAGAGINIAQRVMSAADGNQILVGQPVFEILRHREAYMNHFRSYSAKAKHGLSLPVHQLTLPAPGVNTEIPLQFRAVVPQEIKLTALIAFYLAHAISLRSSLKDLIKLNAASYALTILLWYLATDSEDELEAGETQPFRPKTWGAGKATFKQQFEHYNDNGDFWLRCDLARFIVEELSAYANCFEDNIHFQCIFVNQRGKDKLKREFPKIWVKFDLDTTDPSSS